LGAVKIFKTSLGGREQVLTHEQPGNSVAERPVLDLAGRFRRLVRAVEAVAFLEVG